MARPAPSDSPPQPIWRTHRVACNLCGSTTFVELYPSTIGEPAALEELCACTSSAYGLCEAIVRCTDCGLVYQNPQPVPEDLIDAYGHVVDVRYDREREGRIHTFRRSLRELEEYCGRGRLLDVGSHLGFFVEVARKAGWEAEGIEPSEWAAATARSRGLPVARGSIDDLEPDASYDAVTLWDVIEHLTDPVAAVATLQGMLKPGGVLALSTMDVDAPVAKLLGHRWPWYMQMHLFYFSRRSLRTLVERAGFEVLEIRRHRRIVRVAYLASRLERRVGRWYEPLRRIIEGSGLGDVLVGVDLGDIVTLYARKRSVPALTPTANGSHP